MKTEIEKLFESVSDRCFSVIESKEKKLLKFDFVFIFSFNCIKNYVVYNNCYQLKVRLM